MDAKLCIQHDADVEGQVEQLGMHQLILHVHGPSMPDHITHGDGCPHRIHICLVGTLKHREVFVSRFGLAVKHYAGKQKGLSSILLQLSFLIKKDVVCGHCLVTLSLTINETLKWFSSLPISMQVILMVTVYSDRYKISLFPHLHWPVPNKTLSFLWTLSTAKEDEEVWRVCAQALTG